MEVSPKTLREVEFREKMRGYHPEDVDQFLERVAAGVEVLQDRLRQTVERAQRAEQAASEAGGTDEALRRTLVLAQRTADLAVQEAREQAGRILAGAEQQAKGMLAEADERAQRTHDEALVETRAELGRLESSRQHLQTEVESLTRWVEEHRVHLAMALRDALARIEKADLLSPPPVSRGVDLPMSRSTTGRPAGAPAASMPASSPSAAQPARASGADAEADSGGPATAAWHPDNESNGSEGDPPAPGSSNDQTGGGDPYFAELRRAVSDPQPLGPRDDDPPDRPGEDGDDDLLDADDNDDDSRRVGRLRRRH